MIEIEELVEGVVGVKTATEFNNAPIMWVYAFRIDDSLFDAGCANALQELKEYNQKHPIKNIYITHAHEDHVGGASVFAETGTIYALPTSIEILMNPPTLPYFFKFAWGQPEAVEEADSLPKEFDIGKFHFEVVELPGHYHDMVGFFEPDMKWLFSADAVPLPSRKYIAMPEESVPKMITTMEYIQTLGLNLLFDSHRGVIQSPKAHIQTRIDYLKKTQKQVKEMHKDGLDFTQMIDRLGLEEPWYLEMTQDRFSIEFFLKSLLEDNP